jgi:hypothetical protein
MLRRKKVEYTCTDYNSATILLGSGQSDGIICALSYIARSIVKGITPPFPCISAIIENAIPSEDATIRERSFRLFAYIFRCSNHLTLWIDIRHAVIMEISNAECHHAMDAAFHLLHTLPIQETLVFCCSKDITRVLRDAILIESIEMRAISVKHIGRLLLKAWNECTGSDDAGSGIDSLLFSTQSHENHDRNDLISDEPRRIKEGLVDFIKDVFKSFTLGCLGKATMIDANTGNSSVLDDSVIMFESYCSVILDLMRRYNSNRRSASLDVWISRLIGTSENTSVGVGTSEKDALGLQAIALAHANSAKWYPFVQIVLQDLVKSIDLLVVKCTKWARQSQSQSGVSGVMPELIGQIYLALIHESSICSSRNSSSVNNVQMSSLIWPVSVVTVPKAVSMFEIQSVSDETISSRGENDKQNLYELVLEWTQVHLKGYLEDWIVEQKSASSLERSYIFGQSTSVTSWAAAHIIMEILEYDLLEGKREELCGYVVKNLLSMLYIEFSQFFIKHKKYQESNAKLNGRRIQAQLKPIFRNICVLLKAMWCASASVLESSCTKVIELLHSMYLCCSNSSIFTRLWTEFNSMYLHNCQLEKLNIQQFFEYEIISRTLKLPTLLTVSEQALSNLEYKISCKFSALMVASLCRACEMRIKRVLHLVSVNEGDINDHTTLANEAMQQLNHAQVIIDNLALCMGWSMSCASGESAQITWISLLSTVSNALLPLDTIQNNYPVLLQVMDSSMEFRTKGRQISSSLLELLDNVLDSTWDHHHHNRDRVLYSAYARSSLLSLMSRGLVIMSKHALGVGPWDTEDLSSLEPDTSNSNPHNNNNNDHSSKNNEAGAAQLSLEHWNEEALHPIHAEIFTRGHEIVRLLEEDVLHVVNSDQPWGPNRHTVNSSHGPARQVQAVESLVSIASACHNIGEYDFPSICQNVLRSAKRSDNNEVFVDYVRKKSRELSMLTKGDDDSEVPGSGWNTPTKSSSSGLSSLTPSNSPRPGQGGRGGGMHMMSMSSSSMATSIVKESSLFTGVVALTDEDEVFADVAADIISSSDDVANSRFPDDDDNMPTFRNINVNATDNVDVSPFAPNDKIFSQISGSGDPLTVLACVDFDKNSLHGTIKVKVINSSGFKFDGYIIKVLLKSSSIIESVQRIRRSVNASTVSISSRSESYANMEESSGFSQLPDEYRDLEPVLSNSNHGDNKAARPFDNGGMSVELPAGARQQSTCTEYVIHNGTSEAEFGFHLKRIGSLEVVVRLAYYDLQEGVPLADLWSLLNNGSTFTDENKSGNLGEDDFCFIADKTPFSSVSYTQCTTIRLSTASQLYPYGFGSLRAFKRAKCVEKSDEYIGNQNQNPLLLQNIVSSPHISLEVFNSLWNRCSSYFSTVIPLQVAYHTNGAAIPGAYISSSDAIMKLVNDATEQLEKGVAGGLLPGAHYIGLSARVQSDSDSGSLNHGTTDMSWAIHTAWGGEVAIRISVRPEEGQGQGQKNTTTRTAFTAAVDPLSSAVSLTSIHSSELSALVSSSTSIASTAACTRTQNIAGTNRIGLEIRASDAFTVDSLLEDIDGLVSALTVDTLVVHNQEFEDKFNDSRGAIPSKMNAVRSVGGINEYNQNFSPKAQRNQTASQNLRPFGLY